MNVGHEVGQGPYLRRGGLPHACLDGIVQIWVKRSGGFSGGSVATGPFDTSASGGREVEQVVREIGFFDLAPRLSVGADLDHYEITVRDGPRQHVVEFDDDGSPDIEPLLRLVRLVEQFAPPSG